MVLIIFLTTHDDNLSYLSLLIYVNMYKLTLNVLSCQRNEARFFHHFGKNKA